MARYRTSRLLTFALALAAVAAGCSNSDNGLPVAGIIGRSRATSTPTASPSPVATATATPSPTSSPTVAASPTPAASATPVPSATPTAVPTASPTAAPLMVAPATLAFISTGAAADQTVTASEANYSGGFTTATTTCNNVVSIAAPTAAGSITVQPQIAGTCSFTVSDANGQSATVDVTVTLTSGTIQ